MILEREQFKAPPAYGRKNAFFQKKAIRVDNQRQPGNIGSELSENLVAPTTHAVPLARMASNGTGSRCALTKMLVQQMSRSSRILSTTRDRLIVPHEKFWVLPEDCFGYLAGYGDDRGVVALLPRLFEARADGFEAEDL